MVAVEEMQALVGHRFAGGPFAIEHWENVLLSDAAGVEPLPDGIVHPAALFHAPIMGAGLRLRDLFELFRADSDEAIRAGEFHWTFSGPLREDTPYLVSGEVESVERKESRKLGPMDLVRFRLDLRHERGGEHVASATYTWLLLRA